VKTINNTLDVAGCTEGTYGHQAGRLYERTNEKAEIKKRKLFIVVLNSKEN